MTDSPHEEGIAARLNAGANSAAFELDERYRTQLCRLVEREMDRRLRRKEDPEDVVQTAFRTFYRRNAKGEFHIDSSVDLWRLLATCGDSPGSPRWSGRRPRGRTCNRWRVDAARDPVASSLHPAGTTAT